MRTGTWILLLGCVLLSCAPKLDEAHGADSPLLVAAAASLRDLCEGARPDLERALGNRELLFSYDASSTLARQIQAGALYDVFLSADRENTERVRAFWAEALPRRILGGRLVLASAGGQRLGDLAELAQQPGTIAIAGAEVPAGRYARRLLRAHGQLKLLEGRFVIASNVRATLALVESGAAAWGFVYRTDLLRSGRAHLAWEAGESEGAEEAVAWYGVALTTGRAEEAGLRFLEAWKQASVLERAESLGFRPPSESP